MLAGLLLLLPLQSRYKSDPKFSLGFLSSVSLQRMEEDQVRIRHGRLYYLGSLVDVW